MKHGLTCFAMILLAIATRAAWGADQAAGVAPASIRVTSPLEYQVIQRRTASQGTLPITGTCDIECDGVEVGVDGKAMDGTVFKLDWKPAQFDPAKKTFKAELKVPAGGWYAVQLRALKSGQQVATMQVAHVGIGEVFLGAGQSNSTSCGGLGSKSPLDGQTKPTSGMVTTFDGKSWRIADDPQPGAHDQDKYKFGSFWPAFGDAMADRYKVPIGVAVTGHGGTSIKSWQKDGALFKWTLARMRQLGPNGFRAVLWHQGESDADMPAADYADGLGKIITDFRAAADWEMPWFIAHASYRPGKPTSDKGSRGGQQILWEKKSALEGPDTDAMLGDLRDHDGKGIHFSKKGLKVHGEAWAQKVGDWLDSILQEQH